MGGELGLPGTSSGGGGNFHRVKRGESTKKLRKKGTEKYID